MPHKFLNANLFSIHVREYVADCLMHDEVFNKNPSPTFRHDQIIELCRLMLLSVHKDDLQGYLNDIETAHASESDPYMFALNNKEFANDMLQCVNSVYNINELLINAVAKNYSIGMMSVFDSYICEIENCLGREWVYEIRQEMLSASSNDMYLDSVRWGE